MDLTKIAFDASPNYNLGGNTPKYIILHAMAGHYQGSISWFKNPKSEVSAHYLISQKGEITQMVKTDSRAWHCWGFNAVSIGIEHEDDAKCSIDPHWVTDPMLETSTTLAAALCKKFNIPVTNIIGHDDHMVQDYARKRGKTKFIHSDPDGNNPKIHFPWDRYLSMVKTKLGELK